MSYPCTYCDDIFESKSDRQLHVGISTDLPVGKARCAIAANTALRLSQNVTLGITTLLMLTMVAIGAYHATKDSL
jgi:hypothetical protein